MALLTERYAEDIVGTLSCFDWVIITGAIPNICHADAMESYLRVRGIRLFDDAQFAQLFRKQIRLNAERVAEQNHLKIDFIRRKNFRKEERIKEIGANRGDHSGLAHIFSAMEPCPSFKPWRDKGTGEPSYVLPRPSVCIITSISPIQTEDCVIYESPRGHPFACSATVTGIRCWPKHSTANAWTRVLVANAFLDIEDFVAAQRLSDSLSVERLHRKLDSVVQLYCPAITQFTSGDRGSVLQLEYSTDIIFFQCPEALAPVYEAISPTAIHTVKPDHIATFLGRKLTAQTAADLGNDFHIRIEGTPIKHYFDPVSIKMYDKFGSILRIETTVNDVSFFKHHRRVERHDGTSGFEHASVKKTICSFPTLGELMCAANNRYMQFALTLDDPTSGLDGVEKLSEPVRDQLFSREDLDLFEAIVRGKFNIDGLSNRRLRAVLSHLSGSTVSRLLKRLRLHGLVKKVGSRYKYYLTTLGRRVVMTALYFRRMFVIPSLASSLITTANS